MTNTQFEFTNQLINETSPYLLQHAHNPVDWYAWNEKTLAQAKHEDKMILISIGYSACHWCHVMERESFQDISIAEVMNKHFICIKVDREERPDVDIIYMHAVQLLQHGQGGWPLNCFTLPDGRPFWGGTYFNPQQWRALLENIAQVFASKRDEINTMADKITSGIRISHSLVKELEINNIKKYYLHEAIKNWQPYFDLEEGGFGTAPKFPMPVALLFLLRYIHYSKDIQLLSFLELTLRKMSSGGLFDHVGGGFARYSVDPYWKIPHFEKMLYDNAQLISLYAEMYHFTKNVEYLDIAEKACAFVLRELSSDETGFYASIDADSGGKEGGFYAWSKKAIQEILGDEADHFLSFYDIDGRSYWEDGHNVLTRPFDIDGFAEMYNLKTVDLKNYITRCEEMLFLAREKRLRPACDDKIICAWNALMIKALVDLYQVTGRSFYIEKASQAARFILARLKSKEGGLYRIFKNNNARIPAFLDDYSYMIDALIELHQATFEKSWLIAAKELSGYVMANFYDSGDGLFWYTDKGTQGLVARKKDISDNVMPSSNSVIARALFKLGHFFDNTDYLANAERILKKLTGNFSTYPETFHSWGILLIDFLSDFPEIVICGEKCIEKKNEVMTVYFPSKLITGSVDDNGLPLIGDRIVDGKTLIYFCSGGVCRIVSETTEAIRNELSAR